MMNNVRDPATTAAGKVAIADSLDKAISNFGKVIALVYVVLVVVIISQIILRKGFSSGLIVLEELQWHLYAIGVMFGLSFAQVKNINVRVDLFYARYSPTSKSVIELCGNILLVLPFIFIVIVHGIDFTLEAIRVNEHSDSPSGLPYRWAIKAVIPLSFFLLALGVISRVLRDIHQLKTIYKENNHGC